MKVIMTDYSLYTHGPLHTYCLPRPIPHRSGAFTVPGQLSGILARRVKELSVLNPPRLRASMPSPDNRLVCWLRNAHRRRV